MATLGKVVRQRREELNLSQEQLAVLADVSRSTIRNIEADRVEEARTWHQVEIVLGWKPGSIHDIRSGMKPRPVLRMRALRILNHAFWDFYDKSVVPLLVADTRTRHKFDELTMMQLETETKQRHGDEGLVSLDRVIHRKHALEAEHEQILLRLAAARAEFNRLIEDYRNVLKDLNEESRISRDLASIARVHNILDVLSKLVIPLEYEEVVDALKQAATAKDAFVFERNTRPRIDAEGEAISYTQTPKSAVKTSPPSGIAEALEESRRMTGSDAHVLLPVMIKREDLAGIDNDDLAEILEFASRSAMEAVQLLARSKRRRKAASTLPLFDNDSRGEE